METTQQLIVLSAFTKHSECVFIILNDVHNFQMKHIKVVLMIMDLYRSSTNITTHLIVFNSHLIYSYEHCNLFSVSINN